MNKKRITFLCPKSQDSFLLPIIEYFTKHNEYKAIHYHGGDDQDFYKTLQSSDIAWYEWANQDVVNISRGPRYSKQICRLHSYEFFEGLHLQINWNKFDRLVVVNDSLKELILGGIQNMIPPLKISPDFIEVIPNGVDVSKFNFNENKTYNKKIAFIGFVNHKKSPDLLIQCFNAIHKLDPEFTFHMAGLYQDPRTLLTFRYLEKYLDFPINYDGYIEDVNDYFADKDYVISTSSFESFHYSIAEGMASGCFPLVYNWFGSDNIYPRENIFTTTNQLVSIVEKINNSNPNEIMEQRNKARKYIVDNFSLDGQLKDIERLFKNILE